MSILFVNACVRENSRTLAIAKSILNDMQGEITEVNLNEEVIVSLNRALLEKRENLIKNGKLDDPSPFDQKNSRANTTRFSINS